MWQQLRRMNPKIVVEFKDFLLKTNVFALAIAVVIGTQINAVVQAIVVSLIMPIVGIIGREGNWADMTISFWRFHFPVGVLINALINFLSVAVVVFLITKMFMKPAPAAAPAPSKVCPQCMESIHPDAKKCRFCGSSM
jgi:large conductance mechanosensitive channel